MKTNKEITECPHCGSDYGIYRTGTISGKYQSNYNFDGSIGENSELHSGVRYNEHKKCYCIECNKEIKGLKLED